MVRRDFYFHEGVSAMTTDVTRGLDNLSEFKLGPGGFCGHNGPKFLAVKTVREVYADSCTNVFFLVIEFTPKKGDRIGPLFDGHNNPNRTKGLGPVWHVIRWDYKAFKEHALANDKFAARLSDGDLVDLAVQTAMNDGLAFVRGMKPIGIGPWPKRNLALMAMCDVAQRERAEWEKTAYGEPDQDIPPEQA
jgi:hypothetical protein